MILFLTSSPSILQNTVPCSYALNPANGFLSELCRCLPKRRLKAVFVSSSPEQPAKCEKSGNTLREELEQKDFQFERFSILHGDTKHMTKELMEEADLVILSGGHAPTQNAFFEEIKLKSCLNKFNGVVLGISAGSMNAAETVYAMPELPGEAVSPDYVRFLPGLGLTKVMLLPHYQYLQYDEMDGLNLLQNVVCPDSMGRKFYAIPDGSYLFSQNGQVQLRGEAYLISDGKIRKICEKEKSIQLQKL